MYKFVENLILYFKIKELKRKQIDFNKVHVDTINNYINIKDVSYTVSIEYLKNLLDYIDYLKDKTKLVYVQYSTIENSLLLDNSTSYTNYGVEVNSIKYDTISRLTDLLVYLSNKEYFDYRDIPDIYLINSNKNNRSYLRENNYHNRTDYKILEEFFNSTSKLVNTMLGNKENLFVMSKKYYYLLVIVTLVGVQTTKWLSHLRDSKDINIKRMVVENGI